MQKAASANLRRPFALGGYYFLYSSLKFYYWGSYAAFCKSQRVVDVRKKKKSLFSATKVISYYHFFKQTCHRDMIYGTMNLSIFAEL